MPDGDIYELTVDQIYGSQAIANVHHFVQKGDDGSGDGREALGIIWSDEYQVAFLACVSIELEVLQLRIRQLLPTQTQQFIQSIATPGTISQDGLPPQQCAILRQYGTRAGRKGTGHQKISGVPVGSVDTGRVTAAYSTLMNTLGDADESTHTESASGYQFRGCVLGTSDNVAREIQKAGGTSRIRTVYSRTPGVGQ